MKITKKEVRNAAHPYVPELKELYRTGRCTRREFLQNAALLGMSMATASAFLAACGREEGVQAPSAEVPTQLPTEAPTPAPTKAPTSEPTGPFRGGILRVTGRSMPRIDHPGRYSWTEASNPTRQVAEYLTFTDPDNITHPYLLENWEVSEDLKTWTLHCKKGILFNNGDEFNADDVVFNLEEWLDEEVGSSILGLMSYLTPANIEKVDEYTVKLHLSSPQIAVPEHLYHYPAQIMNHRTFEGDFVKAPVGTGPFTLAEFMPDERVVLEARRDTPYWRNGADGEPLPYLDRIIFIDTGNEVSAHITAFQGEQVDAITIPQVEHYLALKDDPTANIVSIATGQTRTLRMRVDREPWTDNRVRMALKLCQDRTKILQAAHYGEGVEGGDFHVSPVHPEYADVELPGYDPEKAKALLAEAGYPDGLTVDLNVGEGWVDGVTYAQVLQQDAAPAGFNIRIQTMPVSAYWDIWTECDFGITAWTHRPLGVMTLGLAYICDSGGSPVPWNETRWCDEEFTELFHEASGTLDVEERRKIMLQIQRIQMERGSVGIAYWRNAWGIAKKKVQNFLAHPTLYDLYHEIWLKQA